MIKSRLNLLLTFARISTVKSVFSDLQKVCQKSRPFEVTAMQFKLTAVCCINLTTLNASN